MRRSGGPGAGVRMVDMPMAWTEPTAEWHEVISLLMESKASGVRATADMYECGIIVLEHVSWSFQGRRVRGWRSKGTGSESNVQEDMR